jgi:hypothetical protein
MNLAKGSCKSAMLGLVSLQCIGLSATRAHAQVVRVELRDSLHSLPVLGALVSAADSTGNTRADGLSNDKGVVTLRLPAPGLWTLTVRRIGLTPRRVTGVRLDSNAVIFLPIAVSSIRQVLPSVRVTAESGTCGRAPNGVDRAAALWDQISLALRASAISRADSGRGVTLRIVERVRDFSAALDEISAHVTRDGYGAGRPYAAVDPDTLAARGYVRVEPDGDFSFFAPDEVVMLSDAFLSTHCFDTPGKDEEPTLAELRFRPIRGRIVADVEGTAFVDTLSGELRRIEFRFVAPRALIPAKAKYAGGDVVMMRLANGQWIVSSWAIRMPLFTRIGRSGPYEVRGYREVGGTVEPIEQKPPDD